jgi:hypothetical protein
MGDVIQFKDKIKKENRSLSPLEVCEEESERLSQEILTSGRDERATSDASTEGTPMERMAADLADLLVRPPQE